MLITAASEGWANMNNETKVLHVPTKQTPSLLGLWLNENGVERVKLVVEGVPTNLTVWTSAKVLSELQTDVRIVIDAGIARVFPRPSGFVSDDGQVEINGKPCINPEEWADVWPSIRPHLDTPGERFFAQEEVPVG